MAAFPVLNDILGTQFNSRPFLSWNWVSIYRKSNSYVIFEVIPFANFTPFEYYPQQKLLLCFSRIEEQLSYRHL